MNGKGVYKFNNGDVYTGNFNGGKKNGVGKYNYVNGDIYEG
jgi:hypothetical protein